MGRQRKDSSPQKRKIKDPNRPKRSTSAYFYFLAECRVEAKRTGANVSKIAEFTKASSVKWNALAQDKRKPFLDKAEKDKKRYQKEMAEYTGKVKDDNKPKKPATSYFCFLADFRIEMKDEGVDHKEILSLAGEKWRGMSDSAKKPYVAKAAKEQEKHAAAMKIYNKNGGGAATPAKKSKGSNGVSKAVVVQEEEEEDDEEEEEVEEEEVEDEEEEDDEDDD